MLHSEYIQLKDRRMTTDPKDAGIARLTTELRVYMDAAEAHAVETMRQRDRAEKAEAERDAALAQVATAITGNKSGTICRDCRGVGMIHCSDPFNCGGMQPYTVEELKSALSRRDAQMRAEGRKEGLREAADAVQVGYDNWAGKPHNAKWVRKIEGTPISNDLPVCIRTAILAAAEKEASP